MGIEDGLESCHCKHQNGVTGDMLCIASCSCRDANMGDWKLNRFFQAMLWPVAKHPLLSDMWCRPTGLSSEAANTAAKRWNESSLASACCCLAAGTC